MSIEKTLESMPRLPRVHYTCETCEKGKQTKKQFSRSITSSSRSLELIHNDLVGQFRQLSIARDKYVITFVDDYICKLWVKSLKKIAKHIGI